MDFLMGLYGLDFDHLNFYFTALALLFMNFSLIILIDCIDLGTLFPQHLHFNCMYLFAN